MSSEWKPKDSSAEFIQKVGEQEARKLRAQKRRNETIWSGFGMFGLIGWSIVVPTLIGIGLGSWLDRHYPGKRSWTLALLVAGLVLGCMNAWHWISEQVREIRREEEGRDGDIRGN